MPLPTPKPIPYTSHLADFASGRDTPSAFLERCLANVEMFEPTVGAFVHIEIERARAAAAASTARWREGRPLSRIDGMPVGIKDLIETADMPTQCGSPVFEGYQSHRDAASVVALRQQKLKLPMQQLRLKAMQRLQPLRPNKLCDIAKGKGPGQPGPFSYRLSAS